MQPTICAVIALYNGAPFIREALESVFSQTHPADEIIVVDDGSTDAGPDIVRAMTGNRPVVLLSQPNRGQSAARNLAIRHTACSHIAFLDQDDAWYPEHLDVLRKPFPAQILPRLALVYGNLDVVDRDGGYVDYSMLDDHPAPQPKRRLCDCLGIDMMILPGAAMVLREAVLEVGGFDERLCGYEDDDLFLNLFRAGWRSAYINRAVTRWRIHASSSTSTDRYRDSRLVYFHKLREIFPDEPKLHRYWVRDTFGRRFYENVRNDFLKGWTSGEEGPMARAIADFEVLLPHMKFPYTARLRRTLPVARVLARAGLKGPANRLVQRALAAN